MAKFEDLTGKKFGYLTVIERVADKVSSNGKSRQRMWKCQCTCGNICYVTGGHLKNGHTKSCGCYKHKYEDLTGKIFGELTVLKRTCDYISPKGQKLIQWICKCSCGKTIIVNSNRLKSGRSKSCGHPEDLTNKRFGELVVIKRDKDIIEKNGNHRTAWLCQCNCGNQKIVDSHKLKSGNTSSCGCLKLKMYQTMKTDITNVRQDNGYLIGIKEIDSEYSKSGLKKSMWLCKCARCGNTTVVSLNHFTTGNKKSCGCIKRSYGEALIQEYLTANQIIFREQIKFKDLIGKDNRPLRYDFGIYKNNKLICLIEYNGKQHYKPSWSSKSISAKERFIKQKQNDEMKREYANKIGIPLIEIPYTVNSYKDIEKFLDERIKMI